MVPVEARLDALETRARSLRRFARVVVAAGLCIAPIAAVLWCGNPAGNDDFGLYVVVPTALAPVLEHAGAGITRVPPGLVETGLPTLLGYVVPLLFALGWVFKRLVRPRGVRLAIMLSSPLWVGSFLSMLPGNRAEHVPAARYGVIADRDGLPLVEKDGTGQHHVRPYWLRPERLASPLADAARFVLAQQAYIDARPRKVGAALAAMTGAWRPATRVERERLAIVAAYAHAHGRPIGAAEADARQPFARRLVATAFLLLGLLTAIAGVGIDLIAARRSRRGVTLRARLAGSVAPASPPPSLIGLGLA